MSEVLVVGSGGREHAIAWKLSLSPKVAKVYVAPGNGGTAASSKIENVDVVGIDNIVEFAKTKSIELVCVGPEIPLVDGIADKLIAVGIKCFGPTKLAARLEGSKAFSKAFMKRNNIPTAEHESFTEYDKALQFLQSCLSEGKKMVIKCSGLAAGKGVLLPESDDEALSALKRVMVDLEFGAEAGKEVVIEERLTGPEASVLAFCDGKSYSIMPAAQDHKRAYDNDMGPNTGGMGAYAPAPVYTADLQAIVEEQVIKRTVDAAAKEGYPFVGVLYAGMMLTPTGPKTLEFNCRFGDPETQVLLPLLDSDLFDIMTACADGNLSASGEIKFKSGSASTVVAASGGYPLSYEKGKEIVGVSDAGNCSDDLVVFHAGTKIVDDKLVTSGGRVLAVSATAPSLKEALELSYKGLSKIKFDKMEFRTDIGKKAL